MIRAAATRFRTLLWALTAVYWVILLLLTHLPPSHLPETHVSDKLEHFTAYGLLAAMLSLSLLPSRRTALRLVAIVLGVVLAYGALDELTQPLTHRDCSIYDWYADAIGASIGISAVMLTTALAARQDSEAAEPHRDTT